MLLVASKGGVALLVVGAGPLMVVGAGGVVLLVVCAGGVALLVVGAGGIALLVVDVSAAALLCSVLGLIVTLMSSTVKCSLSSFLRFSASTLTFDFAEERYLRLLRSCNCDQGLRLLLIIFFLLWLRRGWFRIAVYRPR